MEGDIVILRPATAEDVETVSIRDDPWMIALARSIKEDACSSAEEPSPSSF